MTTEQNVHWTRLLGQKYRYGLHPGMLYLDEYKHFTYARITGMSKTEEPIPVNVIFDEDYVAKYLCLMIFEKLKPASFNDFQKIVSKAWKLYNERKQ